MTSLIDTRMPGGDWTTAAVFGSVSTAAVASSIYIALKSRSVENDVTLCGDVTKHRYNFRRDDLFSAAWHGDTRQLDVILDRTVLDVNTPNEDGMTPVFFAAETEQVSAIRYLHDLQAELNIQNKRGHTPLMHAVRNRKIQSASVLLELGADPNITCPSDGCNALVYAVERSDVGIVKLLLSSGARASVVTNSGQSPLTIAVENNSFDTAHALSPFLLPSDFNFRLPDGTTPLMLAARSRCDRVTCLLLNFGARVNARRENGDSALLIACESGSYDVMTLLLSAGADVNVENNAGMTCMDQVALYPQRSALRELLQRRGARPTLSLTSKIYDCVKRLYQLHT